MKKNLNVGGLGLLLLTLGANAHAAPILLPDLASFAVLAAAGVTNVPTSTIDGNLGSAPNASIGGGYTFTSGGIQANTAIAQQAQLDLDTAIAVLSSLGPGTTFVNPDLTGLILSPGVYTVPSGVSNLTGAFTLDGGGNPNALWVFQMESDLITSVGSSVDVINTGTGAGVFWNVRSSATLNTGTVFEGNILALTSITMGDAVTLRCGRALAATGNVTLINDTIGLGCLGTGEEGSNGLVGSGLDVDGGGNIIDTGTGAVVVKPVPEPYSLALFGAGGLVVAYRCRRQLFC